MSNTYSVIVDEQNTYHVEGGNWDGMRLSHPTYGPVAFVSLHATYAEADAAAQTYTSADREEV